MRLKPADTSELRKGLNMLEQLDFPQFKGQNLLDLVETESDESVICVERKREVKAKSKYEMSDEESDLFQEAVRLNDFEESLEERKTQIVSQVNETKKQFKSQKTEMMVWTEEEDQTLFEALRLYGKNWAKVEEYVWTRTRPQIASHVQRIRQRL